MIDVTKSFDGGPSFHFELNPRDIGTTVLFGASGSGKTTLLRMVAGLLRPNRGVVAVGDSTWFDSNKGLDTPTYQRRLGYVTQESALFPHLTVAQNVGFGVAPAERAQRVPEMLALVGMGELAERLPRELSGGQTQRVALARAVAHRPRILLLDEPLSALDATARAALRRDLARFVRTLSIPVILVTHDRAEALALGDDVALIGDGRVLQHGPIAEVFSRPSSVEAAHVVGVEAVIPARVVARAEGLANLQAGGTTLTALDPGDGIDSVFACIRADEVVIESGGSSTSARNRLKATIKSIQTEGALVRLDLDCGFALAAYITRASFRDLHLKEGSQVTASIKTPAVHLVARPGGTA